MEHLDIKVTSLCIALFRLFDFHLCKVDPKSQKIQNKNLGIFPDGDPECDPDVPCHCEYYRDGEICEDPDDIFG